MLSGWLFVVVALTGTLFGSITDLKGRWIPDWLSYLLIFFGLGGHAVISVIEVSVKPLIFSLMGAGVFYIIALIMFYAGAWGGGDAKLLVGIGALLPVYPAVLNHLTIAPAPWPFLFTIWINVLLFGALFGLIAVAWLAIKYRPKVMRELAKEFRKNKIIVYAAPSALIVPAIVFLLNLPDWLAILWILGVVLLYALLLTKAVEKVCMYKFVPPSKLVEGDWVAETVKVWGKVVYKPKRHGIEQEDIEKLVKLEKAGKLKQVKIKEGLPYVPAILIGLLVSLFFGDLLFTLLGGLL